MTFNMEMSPSPIVVGIQVVVELLRALALIFEEKPV